MFKISHVKYKLICNLLSIVLKFTSFKSMPPAVTNSSLNVLFPFTSKEPCVNCSANLTKDFLETSAQVIVSEMSAALTNCCHKRCVRLYCGYLKIVFFGFLCLF